MTVHQLKQKAPSAYKMKAKGNTSAEIFIYGDIGESFWGDGVSAKKFAEDLRALGDKITHIDLHINSDGGVVTDARAMYNLLVQHKARVVSHVDGIAASAASFLAMAGDEIIIAEGGFFMIHNARTIAAGEAKDFRQIADVLETVNGTIIDTYVARTGKDAAQVKKWMDAETWFTGKEAVEHGFADRMVENMRVAASISDRHSFKNLPAALRPGRAAAAALIART